MEAASQIPPLYGLWRQLWTEVSVAVGWMCWSDWVDQPAIRNCSAASFRREVSYSRRNRSILTN
jgi:hypothetical protein